MKNFRLLNLNCRQASQLISDGMDRRLTRFERLGLHLHLLICSACRTWRKQVALMRETLRKADAVVKDELDASSAALPADARVRLKQAIESRS